MHSVVIFAISDTAFMKHTDRQTHRHTYRQTHRETVFSLLWWW